MRHVMAIGAMLVATCTQPQPPGARSGTSAATYAFIGLAWGTPCRRVVDTLAAHGYAAAPIWHANTLRAIGPLFGEQVEVNAACDPERGLVKLDLTPTDTSRNAPWAEAAQRALVAAYGPPAERAPILDGRGGPPLGEVLWWWQRPDREGPRVTLVHDEHEVTVTYCLECDIVLSRPRSEPRGDGMIRWAGRIRSDDAPAHRTTQPGAPNARAASRRR